MQIALYSYKGYNPMDVKTYPPMTVVVVGTLQGSASEYRIGIVTDSDYREGLRLSNGSLNPTVAHRCFGCSPVHTSEVEAEQAARALYNQVFEEAMSQYFDRADASGGIAAVRAAKDVSRLALADADSSKGVCGIKILHIPHPWPKG